MKVSIFGLGYVGCVSLACLAEKGHDVIGVDVVGHKNDLINNGKPTIIEKDIDHLIQSNWKVGKIKATNNYLDAVLKTDVSIICVGTPSDTHGHLNLNAIFETAKQIGESLKVKNKFHVVAIRSTVLPGTNRKVSALISEISNKEVGKDFSVVSNPEFLREGSAVRDYFHPPVTVIGTESEQANGLLESLYEGIDAPFIKTSIEIAELIKYVNNSFHALKVSFANEIGNICKKMAIDSHELMNLFCLDHQLNLSSYYLKPGYAYGGSCLPKDLKALKTIAHDYYLSSPILNSIDDSNENQKSQALKLILEKGYKRVGILGLSFKKGTDDLRYSPVVELAENLIGKGYHILIYDKNVNLSKISGTNKAYIEKHIPHLSNLISEDLEMVLNQSDIIVFAHKEKEFVGLPNLFPEKYFIDLIRIEGNNVGDNYEGICW